MIRAREISHQVLDNRIVRFLLAGGMAAACNFGSRFIYSQFIPFSYAVVLAFMTGLTVGFLLSKRYVFTTSSNPVAHEMGWFVLINLLGLVQTWGLSVYLVALLPQYSVFGQNPSGQAWAEAVAHFAGVLLPVVTSYVGHRYLTFRE